jgi:hypothetical protein
MKTRLQYIDEVIEAVNESIWELEIEIFARTEQIEEVKKEIADIIKGLEDGKYQADHKEGLRLKAGKQDNLEIAQAELDKSMKGLQNQNDKLEFLKRYKAQLKAK